ncbi:MULTISPECIES: hypothetical protein [unclassified Streptomyces]|uniref:Diphtheria toxin catalytic domain-containing protein n=1 Tax=Streptomyces sp. NBC_00060 TaxID=2975636 RepID=A0AAU2HCT4_9ACTN
MSHLTRRRSWLVRAGTLTAVVAVTAGSGAQLALAAPLPTAAEIIREPKPGLTGYHGVKPGDLEKILAGIKRPEGDAGNHIADWKGFYIAETVNHAAGYAIKGKRAGGIVKVTLPVDITIATVNIKKNPGELTDDFKARQVKRIKDEFGIPADAPMMDSLAKDRIVLKLPEESEFGGFEYVVPWKLAERGTATKEREFAPRNEGVDEAYALSNAAPAVAAEGCAPPTARAKRSASRCADLDWETVRDEAKKTVGEVVQDTEHLASLPERTLQGLSKAEAHTVAVRTQAKLGTMSGVRTAAEAAGVAAWAYGMGVAFTDQRATTLDKVAATTAIVPGVGNALGIADGIEHHDPEAVAANAVALAALVAAQAVPVVGELVDTALLAEQIVDVVIDIYQRTAATPRPATPLPSGALPLLPPAKPSLDCSVLALDMDIVWDTTVSVPDKTQLVIKERGGKEFTYPASAGKAPGWLIAKGIGQDRTFDVFYRVTNDQGKTLESSRRAVVKQTVKDAGFYCTATVSQESW